MIEQCRSSDFGLELFQKLSTKGKRLPLDCLFELTFHCNLRCVHCYCVHESAKKELSYNEVCQIIDKITQAGCIWITFTGGEPLLRSDFLDIYTYAKKKGMMVSILTNGTLISSEIVDYFVKYPPQLVEISLYGITSQTYEKITRVVGSYERCLEAIKLLIERKIPLRLKSVILTLNKDEILQIREFVRSLGLDFRFDPFIFPRLDGSKEPLLFSVPPEEALELECQDLEWMKLGQDQFQRKYGLTKHKLPPYQYNCGAGKTQFAIDPYGRLNICHSSRSLNYDIVHQSFSHAFVEIFSKILCAPLRSQSYKECDDCKLFAFCGQCSPNSLLMTGSEDLCDEYKCQWTRLLAEKLGYTKKKDRLNSSGKGGDINGKEDKEKVISAT